MALQYRLNNEPKEVATEIEILSEYLQALFLDRKLFQT